MKKRYILIVLSGLLMVNMVSCSNNRTIDQGKSSNESVERTVQQVNLDGTWNKDYSRDEVNELHKEILQRVENACIIYELQNEYSVNEDVKNERGTTVNRNGLYLEIPNPEPNRVESMTYEFAQYGADLSSGQLVMKIGFNLDKNQIKEEGKFSFENTAMSTFSEAFIGVDNRDYTELNNIIYNGVTNDKSMYEVKNNLDGLLESIIITEDYLIYSLESKEYIFK